MVARPARAPTYDHGAIIRGDATQKRIALIFTGGEHGEGTAPILAALRDCGVQASFFVTGDFLAVPELRALVPRMVAEGHYVGPHSHGHLLYCPWDDRERSLVTRQEFVADLERNMAELRTLGALPPKQRVFFIPPFEWFNADQVEWARELGVTLFNFTPGSGSNRDYIPESEPRFESSEQIRDNILAYEQTVPSGLNGFYLLLHLGSQRRDKMHTQIEVLVRELLKRGYEFVRVDATGWE